jgi:hypothetical protein
MLTRRFAFARRLLAKAGATGKNPLRPAKLYLRLAKELRRFDLFAVRERGEVLQSEVNNRSH